MIILPIQNHRKGRANSFSYYPTIPPEGPKYFLFCLSLVYVQALLNAVMMGEDRPAEY
jgi:hypothetical protein